MIHAVPSSANTRSLNALIVRAVFLPLVLVCAIATSACDPKTAEQKYLASGQAYFTAGRYREAAIQFANAAQTNPRNAAAHYQLARAYLKLGDRARAHQELETAVMLQPDDVAARSDLANLLITGKQLPAAKEQLDALLARAPQTPGSVRQHGCSDPGDAAGGRTRPPRRQSPEPCAA
jgi:tetratricopeptide (TPR) repeat protein